MVDKIHYRFDFIGLSTDPKPTATTSPKVVDGSTYYEADTSKLYVWYDDQWYEKEATGGGGGIPTTVVNTIWFGTQAEYDAIVTKAEKTLYLVQEEATTANTLSASPAVLTVPKINLEKADILNDVVTPEEEIKETQVEEPVDEEEPEEEETKESEE